MMVKYELFLILCLATILLVQKHHIKSLNRSAITFIIPLIAFLLLIKFAIKNAIVKLHIENTKEFAINISP